ncbi:Monothiol glutaredoxin-7 [Paramyrothecium foliicola]|nr:Monothiol glutaredoxin-7 [Paramyrothecium foliicola]
MAQSTIFLCLTLLLLATCLHAAPTHRHHGLVRMHLAHDHHQHHHHGQQRHHQYRGMPHDSIVTADEPQKPQEPRGRAYDPEIIEAIALSSTRPIGGGFVDDTSLRVLRLLMVAVLATVVVILFYTSGLETKRDPDTRTLQDFYQKTMKAMDGKNPRGQAVVDSQTGNKAGQIPADKDADGDVDADDQVAAKEMQQRLKAAEIKAKDKANEKGGLRPDPPSNVVGVGSSADGQKKKAKGAVANKESDDSKPKTEETAEEHAAEQELNAILEKAPVIIFSKSYCPFSKRAKGLLLEKYSITPEPYVVELDEHKLGPQLQDQLLELTGRRTVPNIMIYGRSIGGADDIIELDNNDKLVAKFKELGRNRVEMVERFVAKDHGI